MKIILSHPLLWCVLLCQLRSLQSEQRPVDPRQPAAQRQQQVHYLLQISCEHNQVNMSVRKLHKPHKPPALADNQSNAVPMNMLYLSLSLVFSKSCTNISMLAPSTWWCLCSSHSASFSCCRADTQLLRASHSSTWQTRRETHKYSLLFLLYLLV